MNELSFEIKCKHFQFLSETKKQLQKSEQKVFSIPRTKQKVEVGCQNVFF